jgi:hypothetical protein
MTLTMLCPTTRRSRRTPVRKPQILVPAERVQEMLREIAIALHHTRRVADDMRQRRTIGPGR